MTIAYTLPSDVPSYVDTLFDADGVRFNRDSEPLADVWQCGDEYGIPTVVVFGSFAPLFPGCVRCGDRPAASMCCSSHEHELCHRCYRRTHFVELCVAGCSACAREGLAVRLSDSPPAIEGASS